jgi:ribose transport system permease protein
MSVEPASPATPPQEREPRTVTGNQHGAVTAGGPANLGVVSVLRKYGTVVLLGALILAFWLSSPSFLTSRNWSSLLVAQAVVGCVSFAAIFPLVVGEFDLSLGYMLGFVAVLGAYVGEHGGGTWSVLGIVVGAGLLLGLANGVLTVYFKISSFISTLGVGIVLSGIAQGLSGGQVQFSGVPSAFITIGRHKFWGMAISVWLLLLLGLILLYVTEYTPLGRRMYATGGSERVAFLAGIATRRIKVLAFVLAGLMISIGVVFQLGAAGAADPTFGPELLLPAYAAVFLGVTTYRPGYYNVVGTIVAILVLAVGFNGLSLLGVPFWVQPVFNGAVLLIAVLIARSEARHVRVAG